MAENFKYRVQYYCCEIKARELVRMYAWTFELDDDSKAECSDIARRMLPSSVSLDLPAPTFAEVSYPIRRGVARVLAGLYNSRDVADLSYFEWQETDPRPGMWQCECCGKWIPQEGRPFCSEDCVTMYFAAVRDW